MTTRHLLTLRWLVGLGLVAAGGWAWAQYGPSAVEPPRVEVETRPLPVAVATAEPQASYKELTEYTGQIVAHRRSDLAFERPGKIVEMLVDEGDVVVKGQPLAKLDSRHENARVARVTSQLSQARAVLTELSNGPRKQTVAAARAEVAGLSAKFEQAERILKRRSGLVSSNTVSKEEYEDALFDARVMKADLDASQMRLSELVEGTRVERVAAQEALVQQYEAELLDAKHDLADTTLVASFGGRVANRFLDEGAVVSVGQRVVELVDDTQMEVWIGLPPFQANAVAKGDVLQVSISEETVDGEVIAIRPILDRDTRTITTILKLRQKDGLMLADGNLARVQLDRVVQEPGYWVPTESLVAGRRGLWRVLIAEDKGEAHVATARDVHVIATKGGWSYVSGTIADGEQVIMQGVHRVVVNQHVAPQASTDSYLTAGNPATAKSPN